jgi:threonylcarbamoyladenosine tRNA methylthiotransferase MtaB
VYVVNTCSVTSIAESKSRYTVRRTTRFNPAAKVVVTGCAGQMTLNRGEVFEGADVLVPNPEKLDSLRHLFRAFPELETWVRREPAPPSENERTKTRATLKIQDGCDVHCSYCSIPFTRPGMVSRPSSEVLEEAVRLVELGYKEIVLTGVLIGAYGPGTGSGGPCFEDLVEALAAVRGLDRLRISSIEMPQVTERLISLLRDGLVTPHLHVPLQSGDDGVLADMNRRYRSNDFVALSERLYRDVPNFSLTTDVMVGFPTETEDRFVSTLEVCRRARFLKAHVFRFSPRHGTVADAWGDPIPPEEKQRRALEVARVSTETGSAHAARFVGSTLRVLVEGKPSPEGLLQGLSDNYVEVAFAGPASLRRNMAWVRIEESRESRLFGEMTTAPERMRLPVMPA